MGSHGIPWIFRSHESIRPTDFGQVGEIFHGLKNAGWNGRKDVTLVLQIPCLEVFRYPKPTPKLLGKRDWSIREIIPPMVPSFRSVRRVRGG